MATLERLKEEDVTLKRTDMPSRAKYYYSDEVMSEPTVRNTRFERFKETENEQPVTKRFTGINIENEDLKKDIESGNPNILPTGATLEMLKKGQAPAKPFDDEIPVSFKVNSKGKLLFSLYAVLVLALILVIVLNAVAIERQKNQNLLMSNEIVALNDNVNGLSLQTENLNSASYIKDRAKALGMQEVNTEYITMNAPQVSQKTEITVGSNWFDWFCDLLS